MSQSKIKTIEYVSEYKAPQGHTLYVHNIMFENNDAGKVYLKTKLPTELLGGTECTYTLVGASVKDLQPVKPALSENMPTNNSHGNNNANIAGYAVRYATDIVTAEIAAKVKVADPVKRIKDLSEDIYSHIIELGTRPF